jgi:hypothetical protein
LQSVISIESCLPDDEGRPAVPGLAAVLVVQGVDRRTFNGTIIETGTDSYRLAHTMAKQPS